MGHFFYQSSYLSHHGVKGQKWGVQNGPPYPLDSGNDSSKKKKSNAGKYLDQNIKRGKDKPNKSAVEVLAESGTKMIRDAEEATRLAQRIQESKNRPSLDNLSDAEIRAAVNRMNLEKQYRDLSKSDTQRGLDYIADYLEIAGRVSSILGTTATIASIIYQIKKG